MQDQKITVTWDDLQSRRVEARLSEQKAMARNRAYAQLDADAVPETTGPSRSQLIYNSIIYMAAFGILGGLLAWGSGVALQFKPSTEAQAADMIHEMQKVTAARDTGRTTAEEADQALALLAPMGRAILILRLRPTPPFRSRSATPKSHRWRRATAPGTSSATR